MWGNRRYINPLINFFVPEPTRINIEKWLNVKFSTVIIVDEGYPHKKIVIRRVTKCENESLREKYNGW
jgi:hypothetical protein